MKSYSSNLLYGIYTCKLLSSVLNGTEPKALPKNISLEALYNFQKSQDVTNISYVALRKLGLSQTELKNYQDDYKLNILREARFELAGQQVFAALEKAEIKFLPLKGVVIKNLYPNPSLRTFTDVDIFIGDKQDEVDEIMIKLGYEKQYDYERFDCSYIKKPSLHFEMHNKIVDDRESYYSYFENMAKRAEPKDGSHYHYALNYNDLFIYVLAHLHKHFAFSGCGLRQYMDLYVMRKSLELDFEYIRKELDGIGLGGFYDSTMQVVEFLFEGAEPTEDLLEIADYIFNNGTFGSRANEIALQFGKDSENSGKEYKSWKLKYFLKHWGLTYSQMKEQFKILGNLPFLLPFFYVYKFFRVVFFRRDTLKTQIKDVKSTNNDLSERINHVLEISRAKIE